ncbi:(deoxy)nucleoside triphosphate pyrophosphohydrolase [Abyssisolibacter fermentans]|uniref:(deoxy)nucleoside triphosphate pyrophosphohydrolase n=1 Tax=Abyssisolibacter fermentans TaxID=1766203 RepID=UPI00082B44B1|nr:(deoxy)nucleoside triphosphate pyrophosphohydrolase [Abyssisolibacter fermentans]
MITVVAAIISHDNRILIARRNRNKSFGGLWEFPGGKVEIGETYQDALKREIKEELSINIINFKYFGTSKNDTIKLIAYTANMKKDSIIKINEHEEIKWVLKNELRDYKFTPADKVFVHSLISSDKY